MTPSHTPGPTATWYKPEKTGTGLRSITGTLSKAGRMLYRDSTPLRVKLSDGWHRTRREAREAQLAAALKGIRQAEAALASAQAHRRAVETAMWADEHPEGGA